MINCDNKNIVLTGFMGTGKTTIGKLLAGSLKREFIDTDSLIEVRQGLSIPEIFTKHGESSFRQMERDVAIELGKKENLIISTGGRLLLDSINVHALSQNGRFFCLVASPQEILIRLKNDSGNNRPLLNVENPDERILELLQERERGYQHFVKISTDNKQPNEIVNELVRNITPYNT